jgi:hypothetical protein
VPLRCVVIVLACACSRGHRCSIVGAMYIRTYIHTLPHTSRRTSIPYILCACCNIMPILSFVRPHTSSTFPFQIWNATACTYLHTYIHHSCAGLTPTFWRARKLVIGSNQPAPFHQTALVILFLQLGNKKGYILLLMLLLLLFSLLKRRRRGPPSPPPQGSSGGVK